jgi:hypothetical protein
MPDDAELLRVRRSFSYSVALHNRVGARAVSRFKPSTITAKSSSDQRKPAADPLKKWIAFASCEKAKW